MDSKDIVLVPTSAGRSGHMKMLAAALAASAMSVESPREHDRFYGGEMSLGRSYSPGVGGWQYGQTRTSGQGVHGAAKARKLRKVKKKMRQQSRKK